MNIRNSEAVLTVDVVCSFVHQLWSVWPIQYLFLSLFVFVFVYVVCLNVCLCLCLSSHMYMIVRV